MKTAKKWLNSTYFETQYGQEKFHNMITSYESDFSDEDVLKVLKQIQLDAWKQGMSDALALHQQMPPSEHYECSKAIEHLRNTRDII